MVTVACAFPVALTDMRADSVGVDVSAADAASGKATTLTQTASRETTVGNRFMDWLLSVAERPRGGFSRYP